MADDGDACQPDMHDPRAVGRSRPSRTRLSEGAHGRFLRTLLAMGERAKLKRSGLAEATRVRRWRRSQFIALGFSASDASALTKAPVDLGEVRRLVAAGCPHDVARRIVL